MARQATCIPRYPGTYSAPFLLSATLTHNSQNPEDSITPEALVALETKTNDLRTQTAALHATAKALRTTLASLNSTLSTADLIANVRTLEAEKVEIMGRLESLKAGKAKKVTKRERDEVDREWDKWAKTARKRQKVSKEVWEYIDEFLEGAEQKAEVRESLGLDE
jgi:26S proteasome regulatory subunit (ATPase 3-interacting protein)